ncbi:DJ-1/PfpI family protein [Mycoplasma bradburyae]|uniref:DJ-1/PfpI family protein n=1 Tax=Mycoplasma bradburyae TaxID=2963128 RepID=A0AAW6HP67_9MOLU|nr:DJ-1/PfpI family protein [Mycoplasma bradburyae]MDC4163524.1 DJ-1/PfpI family protein [Mycoplasma bradburyae]MDC4182122.1 DJ-1/PfpI family protein [Mycoplasma bradburyae]MDC4182887.1 DJ-1/PfpI family protein [Mycoplasma bradburyae]MDC4183570.1 DJ-1/PfpI family protein [Mycoplasma bradburyae]MDC4184308.1 DJ-1/PfpI family protein [Mycoplasma bradburyae]
MKKNIKRQIRIAAIVATEVDDLELIVPTDLWRRAKFIVDYISIEKKNSVTLAQGTSIKCGLTIDKSNLMQYNAIYLPGGLGSKRFGDDQKLIHYLSKFNEKDQTTQRFILAINQSPVILKNLDLLEDKKVVANEEHKEIIGSNFDNKSNVLFSGNIITARSTGHAIDFAIEAIKVLSSKKEADDLAKMISYQK